MPQLWEPLPSGDRAPGYLQMLPLQVSPGQHCDWSAQYQFALWQQVPKPLPALHDSPLAPLQLHAPPHPLPPLLQIPPTPLPPTQPGVGEQHEPQSPGQLEQLSPLLQLWSPQ